MAIDNELTTHFARFTINWRLHNRHRHYTKHNEGDYHPIVKLDLAMIGIDFAPIVRYSH
jgi:hypothetical protein